MNWNETFQYTLIRKDARLNRDGAVPCPVNDPDVKKAWDEASFASATWSDKGFELRILK